eukprot:6212913-Pleurochrysis_carterae.AAC.3
MVINVHKDILEPAVLRAGEGPGDVGMYQAARVGRLVKLMDVRQLRQIGFAARGASIESTGGEGSRCVSGEFGQLTQPRRSNVKTPVETHFSRHGAT